MAKVRASLSLHPKQMEVYQCKKRFRVVVAGRRWGKCAKKGTLIALANGTYKRVEEIQAGDLILTINENTYAMETKPVKHLHDNGVKDILTVITKSGKRLSITPNHPLLANNKWTEARHLKIGDLVAAPKLTVFGDSPMPEHEIDVLAVWLAEGDHDGYTNATPEIINVMTSAAAKLDTEFTDCGSRKAGLEWRWRGI